MRGALLPMLDDLFESLFERRERKQKGHGHGEAAKAERRAWYTWVEEDGDDCRRARRGERKPPAKRKRWRQRLSDLFEFGD